MSLDLIFFPCIPRTACIRWSLEENLTNLSTQIMRIINRNKSTKITVTWLSMFIELWAQQIINFGYLYLDSIEELLAFILPICEWTLFIFSNKNFLWYSDTWEGLPKFILKNVWKMTVSQSKQSQNVNGIMHQLFLIVSFMVIWIDTLDQYATMVSLDHNCFNPSFFSSIYYMWTFK